ncbi:Kanamycin B dioxygenase [Purpureocillium lavendulum]|uniref:N,O-diacetylmuramidase n=1 Tax=Purpureocillium lavendulum TaxID=1247861 RepID=A0AB34FGW1_9HYPO|nr:Kanamycin B dioxygenase [Purpureocillium lavendulum]
MTIHKIAMVFGLVSYLTERGESTGASSQRKVEKRAYCPVVTCDTLRLLKERRKGNKAAAWIEKQALQEFGPRKTIDVDNMQAAADDCRRVSRRLTDMLQGLQEHARVPLFWTRERPTRQPDTQHMREGKSIKVENVARICYDMVAAERPEHGSPECQFCGGLIRRCLVATDQAYQCGFGPLGSRRERGGFESFSENQRAVYSIACSLVTLRVIAMELQMPDLADHLRPPKSYNMKSWSFLAAGLLALVSSVTATPIEERAATVKGFDISNHQKSVDFNKAYKDGARFVIMKASEGTTFVDQNFNKFYTAATKAKLIRGGYHFCRPDASKASAQASFFLKHGGGWSKDGITLPGMMDLEATNGHPQCYGLSAKAMVGWISEFVEAYHKATKRYPMIYTGPAWWKACTGNSQAFKDKCPLVLAHYASEIGPLPGGWKKHAIWQYNNHAPWGGDSDAFNGNAAALKKLATG